MLEDCLARKVHLRDALEQRGMTYDELVFSRNDPVQIRGGLYRRLSDFAAKENGIPVVSFFLVLAVWTWASKRRDLITLPS